MSGIFWFLNCVGAPFDPFDPSDDITNNGVIFWANNTTGTVDLDGEPRWRTITSDFYTGTSYAHLPSVHPELIAVPMENFTHLAPTTFSNSTVEWDIKFNQPITSGQIPVPAYYSNISFFLRNQLKHHAVERHAHPDARERRR